MDGEEICVVEKGNYKVKPSLDATTNSSAVTKLPLRPCMVCGNVSSGFHLGAYTCEACKAFFLRYPQRKKKYVCHSSGNCEIGPDVKCSFCRYQKCISVGMSIKVAKIGRYTLTKRTEIILEMKKLNEKKSTNMQAPEVTTGQTFTNQLSSSDLEQMVKTVVEGHNKHVPRFAFSAEETEELQKRHLEKYTITMKVFGSLPVLPNDQYEEVYQITGIDIDNRQLTKRGFVSFMEETIGRLIKFVRTIPGFSDIAIEDQIKLVKFSHFEFCFLEMFHGYNNKLKVGTTQTGACFHLDDVVKVYDLNAANAIFISAQTLKKLNLVLEERVILKTVCVLYSDRCKFKDPDKVEEIQWKMVQCLLYLLKKNHKKETGLFARVIDGLTALRELTELHQKYISELQLSPVIQGYPLFAEILAI